MEKILITGAAGFIGFHLSKLLCQHKYQIYGIDTINNYYDVELKFNRLKILKQFANFQFSPISICDKDNFDELFKENKFDIVINLAAQAGVRYSIDKPYKYIDSNLIGFINVLEACRQNPVQHLIFASSSSVYGSNRQTPFSTSHTTDHPLSLYAATKKANEMMAHSYAAMYNIPCTGLRFFTVYGPYGRPDMAYFSFTKDIIENVPIKLYNDGKMMRDFTYVDDIVEAIQRLMHLPPTCSTAAAAGNANFSPAESNAPYRLFNIGNNNPVSLIAFIRTLESCIGRQAIKHFYPMQPGDMEKTYADIYDLERLINFKPKTGIAEGLKEFVDWYIDYYDIK